MNGTGGGVDDPDQQFYENYACGSARNYSAYCNPQLDKKFEEQSMMTDQNKRKKLVWEIDKKLQEDGARPIIFTDRGGTCGQRQVRGWRLMVNRIKTGGRMKTCGWIDRATVIA